MINTKYFFLPLVILLLVPFTVFQPQEVFGAIAFDNSDVSSVGTDSTCGGGTDLEISVENDDVVVVLVGYDDQSISVSSVSDEDGNTYTQRRNDGANGGVAESAVFTAVITLGTNTNLSVTANLSGSSQHVCSAHVYTGVDTTTPFAQATGDDQQNQQTIALALTPADTGQITVGVCVGEWNSAHNQTFDGTATGTERHEVLQGGGDKFSFSSIEMITYTDTTAKDWTCDDQNSGRDIASSMIELNDATASPIINVDAYDIYESESTSLGTGIAMCTAVDADSAGQNCDADLLVGHTYRIEILIQETAGNDWTPSSFDLDISVNDFDVLGDADFVAVGNYILNSGCEDHTDWTESYVSGTDVRATAGTTTNCVINSGGDASDEFWIVFRIHSSAGGGTNPAMTFTATDGSVSDTSTSQTFRVINILE